jgi:hypothetical protein
MSVSTTNRLKVAARLLAAAYLGFYVYGIIMGVFSPAEIPLFTVVALVFAAFLGIYSLRVARSYRARQHDSNDEMMRELHALKERRGF